MAGVTFRPLTEADLPTIASWLAAPHVRAWWREPTSVFARYPDVGCVVTPQAANRASCRIHEQSATSLYVKTR